MRPSLLILGASIRAAVHSAVRSGFFCHGADLFADLDTAVCANVTRVTDYPSQFAKIADAAPPGPWMYTGGLENHPQLIDRIAKTRPLWGNHRDILARVRDPLVLSRELARVGLPAAEISLNHKHVPLDGSWLQKPVRSCAGTGITPFTDGVSKKEQARYSKNSQYYQRFINGESLAALFLADGGQTSMLGVTRQLIGRDWGNDSSFGYCGSIGPISLPPRPQTQIETLGRTIAARFQLRGIFGVDGILSADNEFWSVEVNPRYTASVEILERASRVPMVALHARCFADSSCQSDTKPLSFDGIINGKLVCFAQRPLCIPTAFHDFVGCQNSDTADPVIADIPHPGESISQGHPVATVFASSENETDTETKLRNRIDQLRQALRSGDR